MNIDMHISTVVVLALHMYMFLMYSTQVDDMPNGLVSARYKRFLLVTYHIQIRLKGMSTV